MRCILVGCGSQARGWYAACAEHPDVEVVALADTSPQARGTFAQATGAAETGYDSLAEALDACRADFVLDVTPPAAHKSVALAAFAAGLHVLGEKPMCETLSDAREVVQAGRRADRVHMITQNFRFGPLPRTTRRLLGEGAIGRPGQLSVSFAVPWADRPGTHYVTEPFMFLADMCIHHFDMIRYVLGADPVSVQTTSWNQPWGWHKGDACHVVLFDFAGGLRAIHVGMGCSLGRQTTGNGDWRIEGAEGSITWEDDRLVLAREHRVDQKRRQEVPLDPQPANARRAMLDEFLSAIRQGRQPECSAADNLASLAMTLAAVESAKTGQRVGIASSEVP